MEENANTTNQSQIDQICHLLSPIQDLHTLLNTTLNLFINISKATAGSIQLSQPGTTLLQTKVHHNFPDTLCQSFKTSDNHSISEQTARTQTPCHLRDLKNNSTPGFKANEYLCIPILYSNNTIGVLNLLAQNPPITDQTVKRLLALTKPIGKILWNSIALETFKQQQLITKELERAMDVQDQLLPAYVPLIPNAEIGRLSIPAKDLNGDFHDFYQLDDHRIGMLLVDVTGKGISASLYSAMIKAVCRIYLTECASPKEGIKKLNRIMCEKTIIKGYFPMLFAIFNTKTKEVTFCNAGHEPPLLHKEGVITYPGEMSAVIGIDSEENYTETTLSLSDNDIFLIYSDGATDGKNQTSMFFGTDRIEDIVKSSSNYSIQTIINMIYEKAKSFSGTTPQKDDFTIIGIKAHSKMTIPIQMEPEHMLKLNISTQHNMNELEEKATDFIKNQGISSPNQTLLMNAIKIISENIFKTISGNKDKETIIKMKLCTYEDRFSVYLILPRIQLSLDTITLGVDPSFIDHIQFLPGKLGSEIQIDSI